MVARTATVNPRFSTPPPPTVVLAPHDDPARAAARLARLHALGVDARCEVEASALETLRADVVIYDATLDGDGAPAAHRRLAPDAEPLLWAHALTTAEAIAAAESGFDGILVEPVDDQRLLSAVRAAASRHQGPHALHALLDVVPYPTALLGPGPGHRLHGVNEAFTRAFGARDGSDGPLSADAPSGGLLDAGTLADLDAALSRDTTAYLFDRTRQVDGQPLHFDVVARRVAGAGTLVSLRDRTVSRALLLGRDRRRRLAALGAVAGSIAEDLLDPVTLIRVDHEQMHEAVEQIRRAWAEMRSICRATSPLQEETFRRGDAGILACRDLLGECDTALGRLSRVLAVLPDVLRDVDQDAPLEAVSLDDVVEGALLLTRGALRTRCETRSARAAGCVVRARRLDLQQVFIEVLLTIGDSLRGWGQLQIQGTLRGEAACIDIAARDDRNPSNLLADLREQDLAEPTDVVHRYGGHVELELQAPWVVLSVRLPVDRHAPPPS